MKKVVLAVLMVSLILSAIPVFAETSTDVPEIYVNNVPIVFLNKDDSVIDPTIIDGEVYVPLLSMIDKLGNGITATVSDEGIFIETNQSADTQNAEEQDEKIEITSENFLDYFDVEVDIQTESEDGENIQFREAVLARKYDVSGEIVATVTALFPCEINNLAFSVSGTFTRTESVDPVSERTSSSLSFSFVMPQSGVCTESKHMDWSVDVGTFNIYGATLLDEVERAYFTLDEITVDSGYIILQND